MITEQAEITKTLPKNRGVKTKKEFLYYYHPISRKRKREIPVSDIKNEIIVFLVDDDKFFLNGLYYFLTDTLSAKIKFKKFSTAEECLSALHENPDIIVLDYMLSTGTSKAMNGLSVLKKINEKSPITFVIMLSAQDSIDVALETLNEGAYDYIPKSETAFVRLKNRIKNIAETISETIEQDKAEAITKRINLLIILILFLLFILGRIIH